MPACSIERPAGQRGTCLGAHSLTKATRRPSVGRQPRSPPPAIEPRRNQLASACLLGVLPSTGGHTGGNGGGGGGGGGGVAFVVILLLLVAGIIAFFIYAKVRNQCEAEGERWRRS